MIGWPRTRAATHAAAELVPIFDSFATTDCVDWREGVWVLAVASGVALVVVVESLSLFFALNQNLARLAFAAWIVCIGVVVLRRLERVRTVWRDFARLSISERAVLLGLGDLVLLTGVTAWYAPPNTSDSMAYHMSRVVNWAQHQFVAPYATPTPHQLFQPPFAEFAILQLQLVSGSDCLANFVQWASMLGCLSTSSLIARYLGGSTRTQILSAVIVVSLPMGVLQASSTQNNYVLALWLSAFALSVVSIWNRDGPPRWRDYALAGGGIGLAMCTKGTSYFFAGPFVLLLAGVHLKRWKLARLPLLVVAGTIALLINVGQFTRNQQVYGFPLGPFGQEAGAGYQVSSLQWNGVISNIVRNVGMHLGTPIGPVNDAIFDDISFLHEKLGIWLGSPVTSWPGAAFEKSTVGLSFHESYAGNLLTMVLLGASVVLGIAAGIFARDRRLFAYTAAWASGFVLFSAVLRWHPWETRLDLGWFVVGAPIVAVVLSRRPPVRAWLGVAAALLVCCIPLIAQRAQGLSGRELARDAAVGLLTLVVMGVILSRPMTRRVIAAARVRPGRGSWAALSFVLLVAALPWALLNETRPLLGPRSVLQVPRESQYFAVLPFLEAPYTWAAATTRDTGCENVGLEINLDDWDYPLWVLLNVGRNPGPIKVQYVGVSGPSARFAEPSPPCAVISTLHFDQQELSIDGYRFVRVDSPSAVSLAVFVPD